MKRRKQWCRQYGMKCKEGENCPHEHLDEMPEICDAILDFKNGHFGSCELDKGHKGNHQCLCWNWEGEGITYADEKQRQEGMQQHQQHLQDLGILNG